MKKYILTMHAVEQAQLRRNFKTKEEARKWLLQIAQRAVFNGEDDTTRIFDHHKSRTRLIIDKYADRIITVYSMDSVKPSKQYGYAKPTEILDAETPTLSSAIAATVKRELAKAAREFKRQQRAITAEIAALHFELADALAKQARVYHPPTVEKIQRKADAINAKIHRKQSEIAEAESEFAKLQTDAQRFVATE